MATAVAIKEAMAIPCGSLRISSGMVCLNKSNAQKFNAEYGAMDKQVAGKPFANAITPSSRIMFLNTATIFVVVGSTLKRKRMISNGYVSERTYRGASVLELIHTATLVHDDVVDESDRRRGFFSINALWKNKIAVLVGDFLLSKGLLLCIDNNDFDLLKIISVAVREMSEGELLQIEKARNLDITEEIYYEIIRQKTATLIAACCSLGAASVKPLSKDVETMRKFGELIGMSFQIKDDLLHKLTEASFFAL